MNNELNCICNYKITSNILRLCPDIRSVLMLASTSRSCNSTLTCFFFEEMNSKENLFARKIEVYLKQKELGPVTKIDLLKKTGFCAAVLLNYECLRSGDLQECGQHLFSSLLYNLLPNNTLLAIVLNNIGKLTIGQSQLSDERKLAKERFLERMDLFQDTADNRHELTEYLDNNQIVVRISFNEFDKASFHDVGDLIHKITVVERNNKNAANLIDYCRVLHLLALHSDLRILGKFIFFNNINCLLNNFKNHPDFGVMLLMLDLIGQSLIKRSEHL